LQASSGAPIGTAAFGRETVRERRGIRPGRCFKAEADAAAAHSFELMTWKMSGAPKRRTGTPVSVAEPEKTKRGGLVHA